MAIPAPLRGSEESKVLGMVWPKTTTHVPGGLLVFERTLRAGAGLALSDPMLGTNPGAPGPELVRGAGSAQAVPRSREEERPG